MTIKRVIELATRHGWTFLCHQKENRMVSFRKDGVRINVWPTRGTVSTAMNHPRVGKSQLYRRDLTNQEIEEVFKNPRIHTGVGYYTK